MTSLPLLSFLGHCTAKNKDIGLKFCTHVGSTQVDNMYSVFYIYKVFDFLGFFRKIKILILGVKNQKFRKSEIAIL